MPGIPYVKMDLLTGDVLTQTRVRFWETQYEDAISMATVGKHSLWIPADKLSPHLTGGSDWTETLTLAAGRYVRAMGFDAGEKAHFEFSLPKCWNRGTVTFKPYWLNTAGGAGNVVFGLAGLAVSDDDTLDAAVGAQQTSTDAALVAEDNAIGPESAAITIGGAPQIDDLIRWDVERLASGNTYGSKAYLKGIKLFFTTDEPTDD